VIKSTVPVGTQKRLQEFFNREGEDNRRRVLVASNPEFLREGSAFQDFLHPDRVVLGARGVWEREMLLRVYERLCAPKLVLSPESAEMSKYAANGFLATKIAFVNEVAVLCERTGADVREVVRSMGLDPRIGSSFLRPGLGYGGSCFPKDTRALCQIAAACEEDFLLLRAVIEANQRARARFVEKVVHSLGLDREGADGKETRTHLSALGLAFKPGTDDVRESVAVEIIRHFLALGATVTAYDPLALENARRVFGNLVRFAPSPYEAAKDADALLLLTAWEEFQRLDLPTIRQQMRGTLVCDGWNLLSKTDVEAQGLRYVGVGV
jgi:UDPglucose 6-dehydrogenase